MYTTAYRRPPVGAELVPGHGVVFRVWAPNHARMAVVLDDGVAIDLRATDDGVFSGTVAGAGAGTRYRFRLPDGRLLPDPASRCQPDGPHGTSMVIDPHTYAWSDTDWRGPAPGRRVVYEMHIGTFAADGTWNGARRHLPELADLGITIIELMPIAEFAGAYNWGYDGVAPFAPASVYGSPDEMRAFVDAAHALGVGVVLDVVYNHMGPDGCYMREFADAYFSTHYQSDCYRVEQYRGYAATGHLWRTGRHQRSLLQSSVDAISETGASGVSSDRISTRDTSANMFVHRVACFT